MKPKRKRIVPIDQKLYDKRKEYAQILSAEKRISLSKAYNLIKFKVNLGLLEKDALIVYTPEESH